MTTTPLSPPPADGYPDSVFQPPSHPPVKNHKVRNVLLAVLAAVVGLVVIGTIAGSHNSTPSATAIAQSVIGDTAQDGSTVKSDFPVGVVTTDKAGDASVPAQLTFSDGTVLTATVAQFANGTASYTVTP